MPGLDASAHESSRTRAQRRAMPTASAPRLSLLWLAGAAIRIPLLAVPPVIPLIHDDLHMTETQVGLLIGLPLIMFALAAVPGLAADRALRRAARRHRRACYRDGACRGRAGRGGRHLDALCRDDR